MSTKALPTQSLRVEELEKLIISLSKKIQELEAKLVAKPEASGSLYNGTHKWRRAPTGYMLFTHEKRAQIQEEAIADLVSVFVATRLTERWDALDAEDRKYYNTRALELGKMTEE